MSPARPPRRPRNLHFVDSTGVAADVMPVSGHNQLASLDNLPGSRIGCRFCIAGGHASAAAQILFATVDAGTALTHADFHAVI